MTYQIVDYRRVLLVNWKTSFMLSSSVRQINADVRPIFFASNNAEVDMLGGMHP